MQIEVKSDPTIELEEIREAVYAATPETDPDAVPSEVDQTKITGVIAPLIMIDEVVINFGQVKYFQLTSENHLPKLNMIIHDTTGIMKTVSSPKNDNLVRVQIIPPFDNAYKKVDLRFYMTSFNMVGDDMHITAIYNVSDLYQVHLESFGEITTYDFFEQVANKTKLGFASNISSTKDKRYIYCNNKSYLDVMDREIDWSGDEKTILDYWIDWHNYINLVDIYERYNAIDNDLTVWSTGSNVNDVSTDGEIVPIEVDAVLTNNNAALNTQLYIKNYNIVNSSRGNLSKGTDKIIEAYSWKGGSSLSSFLQDGDIHNDIFTKSIYNGELMSDYNYFLQAACNSLYKQKISSQQIEVTIAHPVLGLERGHKVNLMWYDINDLVTDFKNNHDINTNIPTEDEPEAIPEQLSLNKQVTGQYLIYKTDLVYKNYCWYYKLTLCRPADQTKTYGQDD